MKNLKEMVRKQVAKRFSGIENAENPKEIETFVVLLLRQKDSCFQLADEKMCFLKHKISEDSYECDTFKFAQIESLYVTPIDSMRLGIVFLGNMNTVGFAVVEI